jgi:hypothetical protein
MVAVLFVYLLSLVCWLGGMMFFSALVAPVLFKVLPMTEAGKLLGVLFPRYYLLGYVCGAIGLILAIYLCATRMRRDRGGESGPRAPRRIRPAPSSVRHAQRRSDAAQPGGAAGKRGRAHSPRIAAFVDNGPRG